MWSDRQIHLLQGVIVYFRVVDGELKPGDTIRLINTAKEYEVDEVGVLSPKQIPVRSMSCIANLLPAALSLPKLLSSRSRCFFAETVALA